MSGVAGSGFCGFWKWGCDGKVGYKGSHVFLLYSIVHFSFLLWQKCEVWWGCSILSNTSVTLPHCQQVKPKIYSAPLHTQNRFTGWCLPAWVGIWDCLWQDPMYLIFSIRRCHERDNEYHPTISAARRVSVQTFKCLTTPIRIAPKSTSRVRRFQQHHRPVFWFRYLGDATS